eukprot:9142550-Pyramimonas_sp.AAC.1
MARYGSLRVWQRRTRGFHGSEQLQPSLAQPCDQPLISARERCPQNFDRGHWPKGRRKGPSRAK